MGPLVDKLDLSSTSQYNTLKTQDVGYYVDQTARTCLNRCLCALCHHPVPITHTSTDHLLPWVYPSADCRLDFVDSGAPGRGCACRFHGQPAGYFPELHGLSRAGLDLHDRIHDLGHRPRQQRGSHGGSAGSPYAERANIYNGIFDPDASPLG